MVRSQLLLKEVLSFPLSILKYIDDIYTTLHDGRVVKINNGKITVEIRFTKEKTCGWFFKNFFFQLDFNHRNL